MTSDQNANARFTTDDLTLATTPSRHSPTRFQLDVPDGWHQGRGAFGGLVLGALTRAITACEGDAARTLRSLSGEIVGPVLVGPANIEVVTLRSGSGVSTYSATLTQKGETLARATGVLGRTRVRDRDAFPKAPDDVARGWRDVPIAPVGPPAAPEFIRNMEIRSDGPFPFSGSPEAAAKGWVRPKKALTALGPAEIVALADAWWPAGLAREAAPRPVATIAFTLQLLAPRTPVDPASPLYHRAHTVAALDGYVVEHRELYTELGELIALNQQTLVWIK